MAFNTSLITIGSYTVPLSAMIASSYKVTYSVLDLDSYRDANGLLHRQAIRKVPTVEVSLHPMDSSKVQDIFSAISAQFTNADERKVTASVYIPEINDYYQGDFYIPDTQFSINKIIGSTVYYDALTLKMIGY